MRFNSCIYRFAWPLVIGLFLASSARAQFTSNVQGFVLDPSGAVVAGATVRLRNADTGVQNATKTGDGGSYRFSSLPPGNYVMSVEASGFKKTEVSFAVEHWRNARPPRADSQYRRKFAAEYLPQSRTGSSRCQRCEEQPSALARRAGQSAIPFRLLECFQPRESQFLRQQLGGRQVRESYLGTQSQANSARAPYFFLKLRSMDTSIFRRNAAAD